MFRPQNVHVSTNFWGWYPGPKRLVNHFSTSLNKVKLKIYFNSSVISFKVHFEMSNYTNVVIDILACVFSNKVLLLLTYYSSCKGVSIRSAFNKNTLSSNKTTCYRSWFFSIYTILIFSFKIFYSERNYCSNLIILNLPN